MRVVKLSCHGTPSSFTPPTSLHTFLHSLASLVQSSNYSYILVEVNVAVMITTPFSFRCIIKGEPVNLSVKEKPSPVQDRPCTLNVRFLHCHCISLSTLSGSQIPLTFPTSSLHNFFHFIPFSHTFFPIFYIPFPPPSSGSPSTPWVVPSPCTQISPVLCVVILRYKPSPPGTEVMTSRETLPHLNTEVVLEIYSLFE